MRVTLSRTGVFWSQNLKQSADMSVAGFGRSDSAVVRGIETPLASPGGGWRNNTKFLPRWWEHVYVILPLPDLLILLPQAQAGNRLMVGCPSALLHLAGLLGKLMNQISSFTMRRSFQLAYGSLTRVWSLSSVDQRSQAAQPDSAALDFGNEI